MPASSIFPSREPQLVPADILIQPDVALYYDGSSTAVPTIESGVIRFNGATLTNRSAAGVGDLGVSSIFGVSFKAILEGGAGAKLRCCVTPTKQRVRLRLASPDVMATLSLELKPLSTPASPQQYDSNYPIYVYYRKGTVETPCQKMYLLAERFRQSYAYMGTATVGTDNGEYVLDIETTTPGERFYIVANPGLIASIVVPGTPAVYTAATVASWFGVAAPADNCIKAVELAYMKDVASNLLGSLTSSLGQSTQNFMRMRQQATVLFASNANAEAARTALVAILNKDADPYEDRLESTSCGDVAYYAYGIERVDAGDNAAYQTLKTGYAAVSAFNMGQSAAGKSYYVITLATSTPPTAAVTGDIVHQGGILPPVGVFVSPCTAPA